MIKALDRKLLRDLVHLRGQVVTIALVVACGVAVFVAAASTYVSLLQTQRTYYAESHFADLFASLERAPAGLEPRIAALPGVSQVETRIVAHVSLDVPGLAEPASAQMISLPMVGTEALDRMQLRRGRRPAPDRLDEVVVSEAFALANRLRPGDALSALINGRQQTLHVVGIGLSPELVFLVPPGGVYNDDRHYGAIWIPRDALAAALDMKGSFNDVLVAVAPGAKHEPIIEHLDGLLAPWGGLGAYERADQVSNKLLSQEIGQLEANATTVPAIFLGVAAFLLNVVLGRLVGTQRGQIAALKALGYSNFAVGAHYVKLAAVIVVAGSLVGAGVGAWMGYAMTRLYTDFFRFPVLDFRFPAWLPFLSGGIALGAAAVGVLGSVRGAVRLAPAEAMRPLTPALFKPTLLDRLHVTRLLGQKARLVVRSLERRPLRALLSAIGVAFAVAILVTGSFSQDALDFLMDAQFRLAQREDATVTFNTSKDARAIRELEHVPGVDYAEGMRVVPVQLAFEQRTARAAIVGVRAGSRLHRLLDVRFRTTPIPAEGIALSRPLGDDLGVRPGDSLAVTTLDGQHKQVHVAVRALVDDLIGLNATMDAATLDRLLGEQERVSLALLRIAPGHERAVYAELKRLPAVGGVTLKTAALDTMRETTARFSTVFNLILVAFASIIAVGIVYNGARIALSERAHELATLRVLGFTRREISVLLLGELGIELLVGLPIGLVLGYLLTAAALSTIDPHFMRLPTIIHASTYAFAALVVLACGVASALLVRRKLDRLDLVAVLKTRE